MHVIIAREWLCINRNERVYPNSINKFKSKNKFLFCMKIYVYVELRIKKFFLLVEYHFEINL